MRNGIFSGIRGSGNPEHFTDAWAVTTSFETRGLSFREEFVNFANNTIHHNPEVILSGAPRNGSSSEDGTLAYLSITPTW
jgi:hypothetical protein